MESIREVREALTARSQTTSLDELQSRGRRRVKVIRAENIAEMIDDAVQRAIVDSGMVPREDAERLVERSRAEFANVHAERQREAQELAEARRDLADATRRRSVLEQQVASLEDDLVQLERELSSVRSHASELEQELASASAAAASGSAAPAMPPQMMMQMMQELATLKARVEVGPPAPPRAVEPRPIAPPVAAPAPSLDPLAAALEKLTSSMNDRLEQMGKKMGISSAVEADAVKLDSLFNDLADQKVESNLDSMEVKQRQGGGIAANLARLKKLKGGA